MTTLHVVGAAILDRDRCLVAQRGPGRAFAGFWEFPGGKVELGESPEQGLAREIREELGLEIEVFGHLGRGTAPLRLRQIVLDVYEARTLSGVLVLSEHVAARWLRADELEQLSWAPADVPIVPAVQALLRRQSAAPCPDAL